MTLDEERRISDVVTREQPRLRSFIRRRVPDPGDAEDILQEVFSRLVEANRLLMPIDHATSWLFRVARNLITDFFRKKKPERLRDIILASADEDEPLDLEDLLPSPAAGPDVQYLRNLLIDEVAHAVEELPPEQRAVFDGHEIEGRSFREMAAETGASVNTLLSRKHYAVRRLRQRLQRIYDDVLKP